METQNLSLIAGTISSLIFAGSHVPMLWKAYKTRDLHSYSGWNIVLINVGNLLHWFYIVSLPVGPVWLLHTFYTIASALLLFLYWRYNLVESTRRYGQRLLDRLQRRFIVRPVRYLNHRRQRRYSPC